MTAAERELLRALVDALDLPMVDDFRDHQKRADELTHRVGYLIGCLQGHLDDPGSPPLHTAIAVIRMLTARPLPYTPETPERAAEKLALLEDWKAERAARFASSANELPGLSRG